MGRAGDSVKFDRAVGYYDRTRALQPEASKAVSGLLAAELRGRGPTLEIGTGTGRIALPLHDEGIELVGADLSAAMLGRLVDNAGGTELFPLVCADATALPFAGGSFGSAFLCHVLHLIPDWRAALKEIVRVLRPDGIFLNDLGGWGSLHTSPHRSILQRWAEIGGFEIEPRGAAEVGQVNDAMADLGLRVRELPVIVSTKSYTLADLLGALADGMWSCTWDAPERPRRAAAREVEGWVLSTYGDLSEPREYEMHIAWHAYERV